MEDKAKIVYIDEEIMVLDKASGVVCTNEGRGDKDCLETWLEEKFGKNDLPRQGIAHRLDKGTSGLLLVARKAEARRKIMEMFKKREVKKTYWALVEGDLPQEGEIKMPIARSKYVFGRFGVSEEGKEAWTKFRLLKKYLYLGKYYSLIEIDLKTGRTHQIRVHFNYLGWPLVGDSVYRGKSLEGLKRPFLHSKKMEFKHPGNGKVISFESELPKDLADLLEKI